MPLSAASQIIHLTAWHNRLVFELNTQVSSKISHRLFMIGNLFSSYLVLCMSSLGASCKIKFLDRPTCQRREGGGLGTD